MISVAGSMVVAVAAPVALPAKAPMVMVDPMFDVAAFYQAHPEMALSGAGDVIGPASAQQDKPKPIAGLTQSQMDNAFIIVEVGREMQLPLRAYVVALATALQESNLRNLANSGVAESLRCPHEGVGHDHDSVGLFQQRPSMGWGTVAQLMDPAQAAARFYTRLIRVPGWTSMSVTSAAQAVQRSAFPDAYAKHASRAQTIAEGMP